VLGYHIYDGEIKLSYIISANSQQSIHRITKNRVKQTTQWDARQNHSQYCVESTERIYLFFGTQATASLYYTVLKRNSGDSKNVILLILTIPGEFEYLEYSYSAVYFYVAKSLRLYGMGSYE